MCACILMMGSLCELPDRVRYMMFDLLALASFDVQVVVAMEGLCVNKFFWLELWLCYKE